MQRVINYNRKATTVTSAPASEPVTLNEMKLWLRVDDTADDDLITALIVTARESAEKFTKRAFINQTIETTIDRFPSRYAAVYYPEFTELSREAVTNTRDYIQLVRLPISSVSSVQYYDTSDSINTFSSDNYYLDTPSGRLILKYSKSWPTSTRDQAAVLITAVHGYGATASSIPSAIKDAIKMHVMRMYDKRSVCDMPEDCKMLLSQYRIIDRLAHA